MGVQIQGKVKKEHQEYNGIETAIPDARKLRPGQRFLAVVELEAVSYSVDLTKGGEATPKVRLVSAEVMEGDDAVAARKLRDEAYHARTGQTAPPPTLFDDAEPGDPDEDDGGDGDGDGKPWPGDAPPSADFSG